MDVAERLAVWHASGGRGPMDGWRHMHDWGPMGSSDGWTWLWALLILIGVVALVAIAVLALARRFVSRNGKTSKAHDILDERYARGELDTREYHERLRELS